MDPRRRLLHYLLINVFVSTLVTGTIIFFYDRVHRTNCDVVGVPLTTAVSSSGINVNIDGVIGSGTLSDERIILHNAGTASLTLTGWTIKDNKGVTYIFPQLTLYPGGKIQLHTKTGSDNATDLYWGRAVPIWVSGELAALYDDRNIARAFYRIP